MYRSSIRFLMLSGILFTLPFIVFAGYGLYWLAVNPVSERYAPMLYPPIFIFYLSLIPFLYVIFQLMRLLHSLLKHVLDENIKRDIARKLQKAFGALTAAFLLILPFAFLVAQEDDAPGLIIFSSIPAWTAMAGFAVTTILHPASVKDSSIIEKDKDL